KGIDWLKQKGKEALAALRDWWKARKEFAVDGHKHAVYLQGTESGAQLMVASTATSFEEYISALKVDDKKKAARTQALAIAKQIDKAVKDAAKDKAAKGKTPTDHAVLINDLLEQLSEITKTLMSGSAWGKSSPTVYGPAVNTFGSSAAIERLTSEHDEGSPAGNAPANAQWEILRT